LNSLRKLPIFYGGQQSADADVAKPSAISSHPEVAPFGLELMAES
jgi:hypothetical protein